MKKMLALLLAVCVCMSMALVLTGCNKSAESESSEESSAAESESSEESSAAESEESKEESSEESAEDVPTIGGIAGGWTLNEEFGEADIPEDALNAFNLSMEGLTGVGYEPVSYLGSQVVAGANYLFLCKSTTITAEPVVSFSLVKVWSKVDGTAEATITPFELTDYVNADEEVSYLPEGLAGGWTLNSTASALPEDVQTAFDTAASGVVGVGYTPLAYLGSQVVAGANYAVLCNAQSVTEEAASAIVVVTVYAALDGTAEITGVSGIEM